MLLGGLYFELENSKKRIIPMSGQTIYYSNQPTNGDSASILPKGLGKEQTFYDFQNTIMEC